MEAENPESGNEGTRKIENPTPRMIYLILPYPAHVMIPNSNCNSIHFISQKKIAGTPFPRKTTGHILLRLDFPYPSSPVPVTR